MQQRKTWRSAVLVLTALTALGGCAGDDREPIHIGVAGPLAQASGRHMQHAAEMAVEEINRAGGVRGRQVALVLKDDLGRPEKAIEVAAELRDDPRIVAVVGHINSPATLAAAGIYNDSTNPVLQVSPASSNPRVSEAGSWTFRVCPSDLQHGPALAQWTFAELGLRRTAVLYSNDDYGRGVLESFAGAYQAVGGSVVARDPFLGSMIGSISVEPYLTRAMSQGMEALLIAGQADGGPQIIETARRLGFKGTILGADGLTSIKEAGPLGENVFVSSAYLPDSPSPASQAFVQAYLGKFDELPDHRAAMTYDAVRLVVRTIEKAGTNRRALRDRFATVGRSSPAFQGVSGAIAFDEKGDVKDKVVTVGVVKSGRLVTARGDRVAAME